MHLQNNSRHKFLRMSHNFMKSAHAELFFFEGCPNTSTKHVQWVAIGCILKWIPFNLNFALAYNTLSQDH